MSIGWICNSNYYDGVHKVKHKLTGEESFVYVGETLIDDVDDLYAVFDCKTDKVINCEDYDHLAYYEEGAYYHCEEHPDVWIFDDDDGTDYFEICTKCKSVEDEIQCFKVAEDVYQYNSNREFNRLKDLLKADKYRFWMDGEVDKDSKPEQGLFILIIEYDSDGDDYLYYKTIEKSFIDGLKWSEK